MQVVDLHAAFSETEHGKEITAILMNPAIFPVIWKS